MAGQVSDCMYYQLQSKCARGSRCFFYHRHLEPDICRSFLFNRCKYVTNARQCGKRHVTARDLPAVTNKEKERVKQAKIHAKEALEEFNKPVTNYEEMTEQDRHKMEEALHGLADQPTCSGDSHRSPLKGKQLRGEFCLDPDLPPGVFVGNLAPTAQVWELEAKFQKFGKVLKVSVPKINKDGDSSWAIVQFEKGDDAEKAIKTLNDTRMEGKRMLVKWKNEKAKFLCKVCGMYGSSQEGLVEHYTETHNQDDIKETESKDAHTPVYVGNLPPTANCKDIKARFEEFGELANVNIPKVSVENDHVWTIVDFKKVVDAERAIEALNNKQMDGKRLVVKLKTKKNVKYFCECEIYCTCQVNLEKLSYDNHEVQEQTRVKQSCFNIFDWTKKHSIKDVPKIDAIPKKSEFPSINNIPKTSMAVGNSHSKLESTTANAFKSLHEMKNKHEQNPPSISSNSTNGAQKPKYSTICKSPKPLKTSQICQPLSGFGEGRRNKKGEIECSLCRATFKFTQDFATHCKSSEEHKAATARMEQRMLDEADRENIDGASKEVTENKPLDNSLQSKLADQIKMEQAKIQREDQNQLLLQKMATQSIKQKQIYEGANVGLPLYNNPFLLYDGSASIPLMSLNQANGLASDPAMLLNQMNGSAVRSAMLHNQMNGSGIDPTMLLNQMNGSRIDPKVLLNQMNGSGIDPTMLLNQVNGSGIDPTMLLNQMNGSGIDPTMLLNQMNGSGIDPTMLLNQMNGSGIDPMMLLNQVNGSGIDPMMLLNQVNGSGIDPTMLLNQVNGPGSDPLMLLNQMKQIPKQSDLIEKAERMALDQIQDTIYKRESEISKTNVEAFANADVDREMHMRALTQRQTQLKIEQMYYEKKRLAAQMDLNSNIEQMKKLSEMEKQKKKNIFLEQVEIGRLEELRKLKLKESCDVNTPYDAKKYDQITEYRNQTHEVNTEIFQSEDEEEEDVFQDKVTK